jgi:hypothetical protein
MSVTKVLGFVDAFLALVWFPGMLSGDGISAVFFFAFTFFAIVLLTTEETNEQ